MDKQQFYEKTRHGTPRFPVACFKTTSDTNQFQVPLHWHNSVEIMMMFNGNADVTIDNKIIKAKENDIIIINSGELHRITSDNENLFYSTFIFPIKMLVFSSDDDAQNYLEPLIMNTLKFKTLPDNENLKEELHLVLDKILNITEKKEKGFELMTKALFLEIIALFFKYNQFVENKKTENGKSERLKEILRYISKNYYSELSIPSMAEKFHMSEKYFSRYFRVSTGQNFTEYLNTLRIEKSLEFLRYTDNSITDIALDCGYENISYFNRIFKRYMNTSPLKYRNSFGKKN